MSGGFVRLASPQSNSKDLASERPVGGLDRSMVWSAAALLSLLLATPAWAGFPLTFSLGDQLGRHHDAHALFSDGRPVIFIGGAGRKTKEAMKRWLPALRKELGERAHVVGYVDLRGVPFFVPNCLIRRGLKKAFPRLVVLCDYKGKATKALGFASKAVIQLRVFDAKGTLRAGVVGAFSRARLAELAKLVEAARRSPSPRSATTQGTARAR